MNPKVQEVKNYNFTSKDQLFLDANIWLYIYGPQIPSNWCVKIYSGMLKRIITAKSNIYIDVLIVSEFINTYARLQWKLIDPLKKFKTFRNGPKFKPVAQGIASDVKRMMNYCSPLDSGFEKLLIDSLLATYSTGNSDFNDQVITELCKDKGLTFITHDGDFKGQGISILTANRSLLI